MKIEVSKYFTLILFSVFCFTLSDTVLSDGVNRGTASQVHGYLDQVRSDGQIYGWAFNEATPTEPTIVDVYTKASARAREEFVERIRTNVTRSDVNAAMRVLRGQFGIDYILPSAHRGKIVILKVPLLDSGPVLISDSNIYAQLPKFRNFGLVCEQLELGQNHFVVNQGDDKGDEKAIFLSNYPNFGDDGYAAFHSPDPATPCMEYSSNPQNCAYDPTDTDFDVRFWGRKFDPSLLYDEYYDSTTETLNREKVNEIISERLLNSCKEIGVPIRIEHPASVDIDPQKPVKENLGKVGVPHVQIIQGIVVGDSTATVILPPYWDPERTKPYPILFSSYYGVIDNLLSMVPGSDFLKTIMDSASNGRSGAIAVLSNGDGARGRSLSLKSAELFAKTIKFVEKKFNADGQNIVIGGMSRGGTTSLLFASSAIAGDPLYDYKIRFLFAAAPAVKVGDHALLAGPTYPEVWSAFIGDLLDTEAWHPDWRSQQGVPATDQYALSMMGQGWESKDGMVLNLKELDGSTTKRANMNSSFGDDFVNRLQFSGTKVFLWMTSHDLIIPFPLQIEYYNKLKRNGVPVEGVVSLMQGHHWNIFLRDFFMEKINFALYDLITPNQEPTPSSWIENGKLSVYKLRTPIQNNEIALKKKDEFNEDVFNCSDSAFVFDPVTVTSGKIPLIIEMPRLAYYGHTFPIVATGDVGTSVIIDIIGIDSEDGTKRILDHFEGTINDNPDKSGYVQFNYDLPVGSPISSLEYRVLYKRPTDHAFKLISNWNTPAGGSSDLRTDVSIVEAFADPGKDYSWGIAYNVSFCSNQEILNEHYLTKGNKIKIRDAVTTWGLSEYHDPAPALDATLVVKHVASGAENIFTFSDDASEVHDFTYKAGEAYTVTIQVPADQISDLSCEEIYNSGVGSCNNFINQEIPIANFNFSGQVVFDLFRKTAAKRIVIEMKSVNLSAAMVVDNVPKNNGEIVFTKEGVARNYRIDISGGKAPYSCQQIHNGVTQPCGEAPEDNPTAFFDKNGQSSNVSELLPKEYDGSTFKYIITDADGNIVEFEHPVSVFYVSLLKDNQLQHEGEILTTSGDSHYFKLKIGGVGANYTCMQTSDFNPDSDCNYGHGAGAFFNSTGGVPLQGVELTLSPEFNGHLVNYLITSDKGHQINLSYTFNVLNRSCSDGTASGGSQGQTRYKLPSVPYGSMCQSETQTRSCYDGSWSTWTGSFTNSTCHVQAALNCTYNNITYSHGGNFSTSCPAGQIGTLSGTCNNGNWQNVINTCHVPAQCVYEGIVYDHGFSTTVDGKTYSCNDGTVIIR